MARSPLPPSESETRSAAITERALLIVAGLFLLSNAIALTAVRGAVHLDDWGFFASWVICATAGTIVLQRSLPKRDPLLFPLAMFMSGWGLLMIERLAPPFAERQAVWLILAVAAFLLISTLRDVFRLLRIYRYTLLIFGFGLLFITILIGTNPSGQENAPALWLGFGQIYFQPSELLKVILVAFLASYLAEQYPTLRATALTAVGRFGFSPRILGPVILMWSLSVLILVWQRDLGTASLFFIVFIVLLYVASGYKRVLLFGALLMLAAAAAAYLLFGVVRLRVDIWYNPWPEADGRAYQIVQSLLAFSSGSIFGQGIGQGLPTYIPVVHSDFIFAALGEEWGLVGVFAAIASCVALVVRGFRTAVRNIGQAFLMLLAIGLSLLIGIQSLLIMGGVLKLIPLTGVTLPFFSYGGSSLVVSFIIVGLLTRLSVGESVR